MDGNVPRIGILAVQGDFIEHRHLLELLGIPTTEVRLPDHLDGIDGLIIPGGESTTIVQLLDIYKISSPLKNKVRNGLPIWGTCAGMIVLANQLTNTRPDPLCLMDIEVSRNAFGRQVDSFETYLNIEGIDGPPFQAVFIRAPVVNRVGKNVRVLSRHTDGNPVAVREGKKLATAFHPELTSDSRMHQYFLKIIEGTK